MKKRNKRQWFIPVYNDGIKLLKEDGHFPIGIYAFDNFTNAYSYAASLRLSPLRDDDGELILDDNGRAQLPSFGRVSVIEIDGKKIDFKHVENVTQTFRLKGMREPQEAIMLEYELPFNKHIVRSLKEESDEFYDRSTLAKED